MDQHQRFREKLNQMIAGDLEIEWGHNEFIGHTDVVRQLLEVAPDVIREDLQFLHDLMAEGRDAQGAQVLGVFPRLTDPELAGVEGRISDYIAEHCGIRMGDPHWEVGHLV